MKGGGLYYFSPFLRAAPVLFSDAEKSTKRDCRPGSLHASPKVCESAPSMGRRGSDI
ncbi:hypothetical protein SAMN05216583_10976 [Selenomonas sp. KH1T6]|nr:hypothetical protein SAMN05216583_10976 [Selenomonas ruminantium]